MEDDIESLQTDFHELKSSLHRADRAHAERYFKTGLPLFVSVPVTILLAFFFLLL